MLNNLQVLRALAAYGVVAYHAQPLINNMRPGTITSHIGAAGVDIFFVISGFIMVHANRNLDRTAGQFWVDRIIRIVPVYWMATLVMVALNLIGFRPSGLHSWNGNDLITSLFFLPNVRNDGVPEPILSPAWTLIYEMFFYLIFGLTLALRDLGRSCVLVTIFFGSLWLLGLFIQPVGFAAQYYTNPIILEFPAGCLLGLIFLRTALFGRTLGKKAGLVMLGFGTVWIVLGDILFHGAFLRFHELRLVLFGVPAVLIVAGALALEQARFRYTGTSLLLQGAASYVIYLVHPVVLHAAFKGMSILLPAGWLASVIIASAVACFAVVWVGTRLHLQIEMPVNRFLRLSASGLQKSGSVVVRKS